MKKNVYTYHMKTANHPPASPAFQKDPASRAGDYNLHHVCASVRECVRPCVGHTVFSETTTVTHFW